MAQVAIRTQDGGTAGEAVLDDSVFGVEPNMAVMHQVVTAQLAARRSGTHSTKTRAEVRGGGAKPWRQKGTGRARAGSTRLPHWRGGGVAHGPKPRDYSMRTPKKMIRLALRSALSDRAGEGNVIVVDRWAFDEPRTRSAVAALSALGVEGKALVVLGDDDVDARKSFRNIQGVHCVAAGELNTYDVLASDVVIFTAETLPVTGSTDSAGTAVDSGVAADAADTEPVAGMQRAAEAADTDRAPDTESADR